MIPLPVISACLVRASALHRPAHGTENHRGPVAPQGDNRLRVDANEISWQKYLVTMGSLLTPLPVTPVESPSRKERREARSSQRKRSVFSCPLRTWQYGLLKPESPQGSENRFPSLNKLRNDMEATAVFLIHHGFQMGLFSPHILPDLTGIPQRGQ